MQKKTEDAILNKEECIEAVNTKASASEAALGASYVRMFWEFFKVGAFTIGGGAAMIPQIQVVAVDEKRWLTEEEMLDCIALGQSLPGVLAVNMATFIGHKQRGIMGAFVATIGVILPAFIAIIVALALLEFIGENPFVEGAYMGIKAAVCALILVTSIRLIKQMCRTAGQSGDAPNDTHVAGRLVKLRIAFIVAMSVLSFVAVAFIGLTAIAVIFIAIVIGIAFHCLCLREEARK